MIFMTFIMLFSFHFFSHLKLTQKFLNDESIGIFVLLVTLLCDCGGGNKMVLVATPSDFSISFSY